MVYACALMTSPRSFSIYISSTFKDLKAEREAAIDICRRYGVVVDSCRAGAQPVSATCVDDLRGCDLYVGILGKRYGYRPPAAANPQNKSITEIEYDCCRAHDMSPIDRLIFLKGRHDDEDIDTPSTEIDALRKRASEEQTAFPFKDLGELRLALDRAVSKKSLAFRAERSLPGGKFQDRLRRKDLLRPVALARISGTDDSVLAGVEDPRMHIFDVSPDQPNFVAVLDEGLRRGQAGALWVSSAGLARMAAGAGAARLATAAEVGAAAGRPLTLLLHGVEPAALPPAWGLASVRVLAQSDTDTVYTQMRIAQPGLSVLPARVALPYVIVAPTQAEVEALAAPGAAGFDGFDDEDDRADRRADFERVAASARALRPQWPAGAYGTRREDWQCFGASVGAEPVSAQALLQQAIERINTAADGTRERRALQDLQLQPRAYSFEELLNDRHGSGAALLAAMRAGGVVVVDELALLHPRLRRAAAALLVGGRRTAVVSVSACDPAHAPTRKLLGSRSFLQVGSLISRFAVDQDPRCELAVNSVERLQRWLRLALPDLTARAEGEVAQQELVDGVDALLE